MKTKIYLIIILSAVAISGCYTVLKHPEVPNQDEKGNVYHQNVYASDDCYSCHTEKTDQIYDYDKYVNYYSSTGTADGYNVHSKWDSYYSVPWWFSPPRVSVGMGTNSGSGGGTTTNKTTSSENAVRPNGSTRSDVNITAPAVTRGSSSSTSGQSGSGDKKDEKQSSATRSNNNTTQEDSSGRGSSNSNSNDTKRNSGSTRGK